MASNTFQWQKEPFGLDSKIHHHPFPVENYANTFRVKLMGFWSVNYSDYLATFDNSLMRHLF